MNWKIYELLSEKQINKSSHWRCSLRKGVLRNFVKFTGKHLRQSLFFNKAAGLRSDTGKKLCQEKTLAPAFSYEFCEISKNTFFTEHLRETASKCSDLLDRALKKNFHEKKQNNRDWKIPKNGKLEQKSSVYSKIMKYYVFLY